MTIQVTQEDISNGRRASCTDCPIALGLDRSLGFRCDGVGSLFAQISGEDIALPPNALNFLNRFDAGLPVQPFEFELDL
jgi:hypothetical protein